MSEHIPPTIPGAFRLKLVMNSRQPRLDAHLLEALRAQEENPALKRISRTQFKKLFDEKKILIKGQPAKPNSSLATGITYVDVMSTGEELLQNAGAIRAIGPVGGDGDEN